MNNKIIFGLLAVLLATGCANAPQPLYYWGHYQGQLYGHFTGEEGPDEQIAMLEADVEKATAEGLALPPGFRAYLGVLYGETGHTDKMVAYLEAEKKQFPESSAFMDFLLNNSKQQ
jgi:hypothetical protein